LLFATPPFTPAHSLETQFSVLHFITKLKWEVFRLWKATSLGAILREDVLTELGLSVSEAAKRLGISRVTLSRVIHEHARISPNLALRLESAGVGTARAWLAMQTACDLADERALGMPKVSKLTPVA
jgi:addiction module HigA family antidote